MKKNILFVSIFLVNYNITLAAISGSGNLLMPSLYGSRPNYGIPLDVPPLEVFVSIL